MTFFPSIQQKISKSLVDHLGKTSSATISSYFILFQIMLMGTVYLLVDVVNAIIVWRKGESYEIPTQSIFVLGLVLSHHLVLLGIKKAGDTAMYPTLIKTSEESTVGGVTTRRTAQIGDSATPEYVPTASDSGMNPGMDAGSVNNGAEPVLDADVETHSDEEAPSHPAKRIRKD